MDIKVDARGMACPKPVILTKKEIDKMNQGSITTIVDNEVAKENVSKLANGLGLEFSVDKKSDEEFYIHIIKGEVVEGVGKEPLVKNNLVDSTIVISSDLMGTGDVELGKILMKSFIYTVRETQPYPQNIILYNKGVYLSVEDSAVLDDLKELEEKGVEIISCGTCLDYYHLKEKLAVGSISNMYTIYDKLRNSQNLTTIG